MRLDYVLRVLPIFSVQFWSAHCSVLTLFALALPSRWITNTHVAFLLQLKKLNVFKTCAQHSRRRRKILLTTRLKCINNFRRNICTQRVDMKYEHFLGNYRGNAPIQAVILFSTPKQYTLASSALQLAHIKYLRWHIMNPLIHIFCDKFSYIIYFHGKHQMLYTLLECCLSSSIHPLVGHSILC